MARMKRRSIFESFHLYCWKWTCTSAKDKHQTSATSQRTSRVYTKHTYTDKYNIQYYANNFRIGHCNIDGWHTFSQCKFPISPPSPSFWRHISHFIWIYGVSVYFLITTISVETNELLFNGNDVTSGSGMNEWMKCTGPWFPVFIRKVAQTR